jgi:hypothetical protein
MATTMYQSIGREEERFVSGANLSGANLSNANLIGANLSGANLDEDYEDWVHEQNMDAEFDMVDYHTNKNRKLAQNVRDKKLTKPKQDEAQKELYKQKMKELEEAKQLKIQKNKERKAEDNLRILQRKDKQDIKDIGLDENQYRKLDQIELETEALVKDNWDDGLDW